MNEKMNIPKTIHAGYQKRGDTYTGKLAYVIYTDEKGKKRKEQSWQGWRDTNIPPTDHTNEPISGFVLNKGVGGARESWGWNARNEYIRVYDPRGFEIEISVANLLFILAECTSTKGKGLEGDFVYAWSGTDLVLLPTCSYEYKTSTEFTSMKTMKVDKSSMKEGHIYQHKNTHTLVYLGRHAARKSTNFYSSDFVTEINRPSTTKYHVFKDLTVGDKRYSSSLLFETGFTNLARKLGDDPHPDFANLYSAFTSSAHCDAFDSLVLEPINSFHHDDFRYDWFIVDDNGKRVVRFDSSLTRSDDNCGKRYYLSADLSLDSLAEVYNQYIEYNKSRWGHYGGYRSADAVAVSADYLKDKKIYKLKCKLKSGTIIGVPHYVK